MGSLGAPILQHANWPLPGRGRQHTLPMGMQIMVPGEDGEPSSIKERDNMDVSELRPPPGDDTLKPITECTLGESLSAYVKAPVAV